VFLRRELSISDRGGGGGGELEKKRGEHVRSYFFRVGEGDHLKGEIRVDQSKNSPTVLVSSSGWVPACEGAISSEDRVARNYNIPRVGEINLLEKHHASRTD